MYFILEPCLFNVRFQGKQQQQQKQQTENSKQQQQEQVQQPYNIILFLHIFSASSSSIIIEVIGSAILMQVGERAGSIPLRASDSIRTITMYYVHVRKIHQSRISETGGTLHYTVLQTHWCTCLHYR